MPPQSYAVCTDHFRVTETVRSILFERGSVVFSTDMNDNVDCRNWLPFI